MTSACVLLQNISKWLTNKIISTALLGFAQMVNPSYLASTPLGVIVTRTLREDFGKLSLWSPYHCYPQRSAYDSNHKWSASCTIQASSWMLLQSCHLGIFQCTWLSQYSWFCILQAHFRTPFFYWLEVEFFLGQELLWFRVWHLPEPWWIKLMVSSF